MSRNIVLVIDDDAQLCELLEDYLARFDYDMIAAHDGPSGLVSVQKHHPDLVVLDVMIPHLDGFEVLKEIRKESRLPVIRLAR